MCADAFMFIWPKRQFVGEMLRLIDDGRGLGAAVISHTHNQLQWSPSLGQPLPPAGYRNLFETLEPRVFSEGGLFEDVVKGGPLDLARHDPAEVIDRDPALVIVATAHPEVFAPMRSRYQSGAPGELRVNPLYVAEPQGERRVLLHLQFPSADYEDEFGACREYLPEAVARQSRIVGGPGHRPSAARARRTCAATGHPRFTQKILLTRRARDLPAWR